MLEIKVIQVNLLKKALEAITDMATVANLKYSQTGLSLQAADSYRMVIVVLRIKSSDFSYFHCDKDSSVGVDLERFYEILNHARPEEAINIHSDDGDDIMGFLYWKETRCTGYAEMRLIPVIHALVNIDVSKYKYDVVVGIPSQEFRRIFWHLNLFGETVFISVTDQQVEFSTVNEEIILKKEHGDCIIGGAATGRPVYVFFSFYNMSSFLNASVMSSMVWILHSYDSPPMLNCPAGVLGNIMFYFS